MNEKQASKLRRRADELIVEWLKTMVPEGEDTSRITTKNIEEFLPSETHFYANGQQRLYFMSRRWVYKFLKKHPEATLEDILNAQA